MRATETRQLWIRRIAVGYLAAQGLAVLEAAACGVLPVGTPVGVLPQVGRTAETEAGLLEVLVELLHDTSGRQSQAGSALAR